jgi:cytochrome c553
VLIAITTNGKIGLAVLAGLFIAFALLSSFYFPRRNPDFPGNRLGLFTLVAAVLFVGTMAGVFYFAKEEEHAEAAETHGADDEPETSDTTGGATEPTETETTGGETTETLPTETDGGTGTGEDGGEAEGDAAAGEEVFASAGCGGCHALEAAGASGNVGPDLDDSKPPHDLVVDRVTNGQGAMPAFEGQLTDQQIQDVAAYVVASTQG